RYSIASSALASSIGGASRPSAQLQALHRRCFGCEVAELIGREGSHRRRARTTSARDRARELHHSLAVRHFHRNDNVIMASRYIGAEQLSPQFFDRAFGGLKSFAGLFCILGALGRSNLGSR